MAKRNPEAIEICAVQDMFHIIDVVIRAYLIYERDT
jgi:hypothetical protein